MAAVILRALRHRSGTAGNATRGDQAAPLTLEVTEVLGPTTSKAAVRGGSARRHEARRFIEVETFGVPLSGAAAGVPGNRAAAAAEMDAMIEAPGPCGRPVM